jgi:hypothetical protein
MVGAGWLTVPGEAPIEGPANAKASTMAQGVAKTEASDPWATVPVESRELWKFRLTIGR